MKKAIVYLSAIMITLSGCGSDADFVTRSEYEQVVAERDEYKEKYEDLLEEYAGYILEQKIEEIENGQMTENIQEDKEVLEDFRESDPYYEYSGSGDDVISGFISNEGYSFAKIIYNGSGHFSVKGYYDNSYDLLVSTINHYEGSTLIYPEKEYTFEVKANGDWTIEIYSIGTSSIDEFTGSGDFVTPIFIGTSDIYEITSTGSGHFSIKGWCGRGYDLLVSTIDEDYSGKVVFEADSKYAFFVISSDREWTIRPAK